MSKMLQCGFKLADNLLMCSHDDDAFIISAT